MNLFRTPTISDNMLVDLADGIIDTKSGDIGSIQIWLSVLAYSSYLAYNRGFLLPLYRPYVAMIPTEPPSAEFSSNEKLREVKEGFGNQIHLCRDRGLNPGPPVQKFDTLHLDHQIRIELKKSNEAAPANRDQIVQETATRWKKRHQQSKH
uniref:Uncharacterized protein n=1 Tax=Timema douglasi TaxID=61478 RepID=A0A7R8VJJ0_TIMDO|nr:unnamed protein product [Timema douglasi]